MSIKDFINKTNLDLEIEYTNKNRLFGYLTDGSEYFYHYRVLFFYNNRKIETFVTVTQNKNNEFTYLMHDKSRLIPLVLDQVLNNVGAAKLSYDDWLKYNNDQTQGTRVRKAYEFSRANAGRFRKFCGDNWKLLSDLIPDSNKLVENGFLDLIKKNKGKPKKKKSPTEDLYVNNRNGLFDIAYNNLATTSTEIVPNDDYTISVTSPTINLDSNWNYYNTNTLDAYGPMPGGAPEPTISDADWYTQTLQDRMRQLEEAARRISQSVPQNIDGDEPCDDDIPF